MTAEQLEELLGKIADPNNKDAASHMADLWRMAPSLARRVIAAEKLVREVNRVQGMIAQRWQTTAGDKCFISLDEALTAYREASKGA